MDDNSSLIGRRSGKPFTIERARELLHYDPQTGAFTRKIGWGRVSPVGKQIGSIMANKYVHIGIDGLCFYAHRLAWFYITGSWPRGLLDHIDGDSTNNRFANLREATSRQNSGNSKLSKANTSGRKGVSWAPKRGKWRASIVKNRRQIFLGYYPSIEDASAAYRSAALDVFGKFARIQ